MWLASNMKQGCVKCAPFLSRQMLQAYPARPVQLIASEQVASFKHREKHMAQVILKEAMNNPDQENFVAFVGREHLLSVAQNLGNFINNPKDFMEYSMPP